MSKRALTKLRDELLELQFELRHSKRAAIALIVTGAPSAGRSESVNELLEWLDPKYVRVHAFGKPDVAERQRPPMWRYWLTLPELGRMAFYFSGWYADVVTEAHGAGKRGLASKRAIARIRQLETMLVADGVKVVKVHLHIDRRTQRERLKCLLRDPLTSWRVTEEDRWLAKHYATATRVAKRCIRETQQRVAPWHIVDGSDSKQRLIDVAKVLRDAMKQATAPAAKRQITSRRQATATAGPLPKVKATRLDDDVYETELATLQGRLARAVRSEAFRKRGLVLAFEGLDAAGKGGAIRRITHALDARQYQVVPVSAPSPEEALHPYLWRFWKQVPERGEIAIFDRSWYGRVLVERVRGFTSARDWRRAYEEINEFERQLAECGLVVAKFWLAVGKSEQLKRFKNREEDRLKRFKVDQEDWVNRRHYDAYQQAASDMIRLTDLPDAPWHVIDADEKKHARLEVLRNVCAAIERRME